jgi:hypothetical protein
MKKLLPFLAIALWVSQAQASIIFFDLTGLAGFGLRGGNETTALNGTPGSGGETGAGIFYDDVSNLLTINAAWGSANGFTDLTGPTIAGHLHGPTASGGVAAYNQTAAVKYPLNTLAGWNNSASSGGFNGSITILAADEAALLNGQFYFNAHTTLNSGGEIRGQLIAVPEPSLLALAGLGVVWALVQWRGRRTRRSA